jgi:DNA-binding CsgD family transcriptional regulator
VLILLTCLREDYAEGVRLSELAKRHATNTMGFQLLYWALAALACGLGRSADVRAAIQNVLQLAVPRVNPGPTIWIVPCVAYMLAATDPEQALELLAWVCVYPHPALHWVRDWPLVDRLQTQLRDVMAQDEYHRHWENGTTLTIDAITTDLHQAFRTAVDGDAEAARQPLLTAREREILGLIAAGMTNPQIAVQLVIGAGTVKTHTLNIYRKLEVATRTQAIVRAQALGLLRP